MQTKSSSKVAAEPSSASSRLLFDVSETAVMGAKNSSSAADDAAPMTNAVERDARIVGDRPNLRRVIPRDMQEDCVLVRIWLEKCVGLPLYHVLGESNPYIRMKLTASGDDTLDAQAQQSTTKFRTQSPEWAPHERFEFLLPAGLSLTSSKVVVQLGDSNTLRPDTYAAHGVIPLHKVQPPQAAGTRASEHSPQMQIQLFDPKARREPLAPPDAGALCRGMGASGGGRVLQARAREGLHAPSGEHASAQSGDSAPFDDSSTYLRPCPRVSVLMPNDCRPTSRAKAPK